MIRDIFEKILFFPATIRNEALVSECSGFLPLLRRPRGLLA